MGDKLEAGQDKTMGWLGYLNHRGLMNPTKEFQNLIAQFDLVLVKYHGHELTLEKFPIETFTRILKSQFPSVPEELLFFYSKVRFFIRLKHLNKCLNLELIESKKKHNIHVNKYM
jgi:hypothetical protein